MDKKYNMKTLIIYLALNIVAVLDCQVAVSKIKALNPQTLSKAIAWNVGPKDLSKAAAPWMARPPILLSCVEVGFKGLRLRAMDSRVVISGNIQELYGYTFGV